MPHFDDYDALTSVLTDDEVLVRDKHDTSNTGTGASASAKTKRVTALNLAKALAALAGSLVMLQPSGDTSGAADATAIAAAYTALSGSPGLIKLSPSAPWYIACGTVVINASGVYIDATGCVIHATGSGAMIDMHDSSDINTRAVQGGGIIGFPVIDGTSCTGTSQGIVFSDIFQGTVDAQTQNFTAGTLSKGFYFNNRYYWTEQLHARVLDINSTQPIVFDCNAGTAVSGASANATGSFERSKLDLNVLQFTAANDGIIFQNGAFVEDGKVECHGNFGTSATSVTTAAMRFTGTTPSGCLDPSNSGLTNCTLDIGFECDGTNAHTPYSIFFTDSENSIFACSGNVDFGAAVAFLGSNSNGQFGAFVGVVVGDPALFANLPAGSGNMVSGAQIVSATSATALAGLAAQMAPFTAYDIRIYIPHLGAGTTGTFTFALGGLTIAAASLDIKLWTGATLTTHTLDLTTGTLLAVAPSASQRTLEVSGTIAMTTAGTLTVTGAKTSGGSNVTVDAGASILLTPLASP